MNTHSRMIHNGLPRCSNLRRHLCRLAASLCLVLVLSAQAPENKQVPPINTEQRSQEVIRDQPQPSNRESHTENDRSHSGEEGTEFWPTVIGLHLKITDTLLVAFTFVLALFTAGLWYSTHRLQKAALEQGKDMQKSISEAGRAASAMENVAATMLKNVEIVTEVGSTNARIAEQQSKLWPMQMRAYVSVIVGSAIYQDGRLKFEGKPTMVNNGNTPAYNVRYQIHCAVLSSPVGDDFDFNTIVPEKSHGTVLAPGQHGIMSRVINETFSEEEVGLIKAGVGRALHVWGKVLYDDVFDEQHFTEFCQVIQWHGDNLVMGHYLPHYSKSN